jgi:hypothetical protein
MKEYRYNLEKGSRKQQCPECGKRTFHRYTDSKTGELIPERYGRCDREINCSYHSSPYSDGFAEANRNPSDAPGWTAAPMPAPRPRPKPQPKPASFIPWETLTRSRSAYEYNNFVMFLVNRFGRDHAERVIGVYNIGTSKHWPGSTIFWQIDNKGNARAGKIMLYNQETGKRVKDSEGKGRITWAHKAMKLEGFNLHQCFFGEHLLALRAADPVALVESEKTACIASLYHPSFVWLACGSLTGFNTDKCEVLQGREVTIFPDLGGFDKWQKRAEEIAHTYPAIRFKMSDLLEGIATEQEREAGLDIADYLLRFEPGTLPVGELKSQPTECDQIKERETVPKLGFSSLEIEPPAAEKSYAERERTPAPEIWDLSELESLFGVLCINPDHSLSMRNGKTVPERISLSKHETIINPRQFLRAHMDTIRANNGRPSFRPYLDRLHQLKEVLQSKY